MLGYVMLVQVRTGYFVLVGDVRLCQVKSCCVGLG
jgi:hypothetical protein